MIALWTESAAAFAGGLLLGFFFFGGLWLTLRRLPFSRRPRSLVWSSFLIRQILTVTALIILCRSDWQKWAAALAGFLLVRTVMIYHETGKKTRIKHGKRISPLRHDKQNTPYLL